MANFEISGYEIYELLGRGGMAVVYRALHLNLDRDVAIKVMDTSLNSDETFAERFIREARISARLVHPHILQIYDVNSHGTLNYISMELLEGGDLADSIRGAMKQRTIYSVMEQMTDALDYAASKGYVHRDIKPSNIMLRGEEDYVLADFGIAKASDSGTQMTQTGLMVGTPSYMSPEQAKGIEVDGRSDLYSLAVLCYEMLTKELPYDSDSAVSTAVKHLTEKIPRLPEALAPYQPFIDKALAKNAEDRFQTGQEMFQAFSEIRGQFSEDQVLVESKAPVERKKTGARMEGDSHTSIAWDDSTRVESPSRPSRPYKLDDTAQREPLLSGMRGEARAVQRQPSGSSSIALGLVAGVVLVGAAAFGGYSYWQGRQNTPALDVDVPAMETQQPQVNIGVAVEQVEYATVDVETEQAAIAEVKIEPEQAVIAEAEQLAIASAEAEAEQAAIARAEAEAEQVAIAQAKAAEEERAAMARAEAEQRAAIARVEAEAAQLADTGMTAVTNGDLELAAGMYAQLATAHPDREANLQLKSLLLAAYVEAAREEISAGEYELAEAYLALGRELAPHYATWSELEEEISVSRTSNRRRLGTY